MAEKLQAGDVFNKSGFTYLVIGANEQSIVGVDLVSTKGWYVTYTSFHGTDDLGFAKLPDKSRTAFQFVTTGNPEFTLGEVEIIDKFEWKKFGWREKP